MSWQDVDGSKLTVAATILQANFAGDILNFVLDAFRRQILLKDFHRNCGHTPLHEAKR